MIYLSYTDFTLHLALAINFGWSFDPVCIHARARDLGGAMKKYLTETNEKLCRFTIQNTALHCASLNFTWQVHSQHCLPRFSLPVTLRCVKPRIYFRLSETTMLVFFLCFSCVYQRFILYLAFLRILIFWSSLLQSVLLEICKNEYSERCK